MNSIIIFIMQIAEQKGRSFMENNRSSFASNFGFLMAAIGSAVGLGNIWGFPYKMGKSGGFTFLIVYLLLAMFVGLIIMTSELALGRKTKLSPIDAYKVVSKKFAWIGWLAIIAPFLIMSFYSVLGGYVLQYMSLNLAELSFGLSGIFGQAISGSATFGAMLTNQFGCFFFTLLFMIICMVIRSLTLPNAVEGLKFMFVPGYAVKGGFIESSPDLITVLGTAGGQMFFSLSLAMGAILTYGSYLSKEENLVSNSITIVVADTLIAILAGIAVIPAAVANGINNGIPVNEISLNGPKLLFVTLQDVFTNMGKAGPLFGVIFYLLVLLAAISSAISLMEAVGAHWIDKDLQAGKGDTRKGITLIVSLLITVEALLVAVDGLGSNGIHPAALLGIQGPVPDFIADWLDFMDCWSEGIAMPLGAMLMALMIGWELTPNLILEEVGHGNHSPFFGKFYTVCVRFVVPIVMAFVLAGQMIGFFGGSQILWYVVAFGLLVIFWVFAANGKKQS